MELADSESRLEWYNRCCELQNALGQAEKTYIALKAENTKLKKEIGALRAKAAQKGLMSHGSFTGKH